jgi:hypothetical protein
MYLLDAPRVKLKTVPLPPLLGPYFSTMTLDYSLDYGKSVTRPEKFAFAVETLKRFNSLLACTVLRRLVNALLTSSSSDNYFDAIPRFFDTFIHREFVLSLAFVLPVRFSGRCSSNLFLLMAYNKRWP